MKLISTLQSWSSENKIMTWLAIDLAIYAIVFFSLSADYPSLRDVYIGMATSTLTIGITVFFVDVIIKANSKIQWEDAEKVARDHVAATANELVSRIFLPISLSIMKEWLNKVSELVNASNYYPKEVADWSLKKLIETGSLAFLSQLTDDSWVLLYKDILRLETDLRDCITLYKDILPPKLLGGLLEFNKDFKEDYSIFGTSLSIFIKQIGTSKLNSQTKEVFIESFAKDLDAYFIKVAAFRSKFERNIWP